MQYRSGQRVDKVTADATPYATRRTVRYHAAANAKEAIKRQFPELFSQMVAAGQPPQRDRQGNGSYATEAA